MFARTENVKQFLARYPVLSLIVAANAAVFLFTYAIFGLRQPEAVYSWAGLLPDTGERGEWWRLVTYAFLHAGFSHFLMNIAFLLIVAPPLEYMLGHVRFLLLFLVSILSTSVLVYAAGNEAAVGVSGFCYGVLGVFAVLALRRKNLLDRTSAQVVWSWIGVGWAGTLFVPGISILGHLGGFIGGVLFGIIILGSRARLTVWIPVPPRKRIAQAPEQDQRKPDATDGSHPNGGHGEEPHEHS